MACSEPAARLLASLPRGKPGDLPLAVTALAAWLSGHAQRSPSPPVPVCDASGRWQVVQVHRLDGAVPPGTMAVTLNAAAPPQLVPLAMAAAGLTAREREVVALVLAGLATAEIAVTLRIAPCTVQDHLRGVFRKLGVADRYQLTAGLLHRPRHDPPRGGRPTITTRSVRVSRPSATC